jgi:hypothetical protein
MQPNCADQRPDNRLRVVFDDAVLSIDLAADATYEDIARTLAALALRHQGHPVAIAVTLPASAVGRGATGLFA